MKLKADINWGLVKKYLSPHSIKDFDAFLDVLPVNVGYNALISAGIAWLVAGITVMFTMMQVEHVSRLRAELAKVGAMKPPIPIIKYEPIPEATLTSLSKKISETYKGIVFVGSASSLTVSAPDTDYFPQFLAALNTLQNGGKNWRVTISSLCVGSECTASKLSAVLKVEMARVGDAPKEDMNNENKI